MGISGSLVLIAAGAILKWAVTATVSGINLQTIGVILMIVGAGALVISLGMLGTVRARKGRTTVVRDTTPAREGATTVVRDGVRWVPS